jgi:NAD(P)-dependent dehydrogenase (short-subunit alcohol dehydrogenase family)
MTAALAMPGRRRFHCRGLAPEDAADALMLMLADEAQFITGQKLVADGGQNMW